MTPQDLQTAIDYCDAATTRIDAIRGNVAQVRSMLAVDLGNSGTPQPPVVPPIVVPPVVVPPVVPPVYAGLLQDIGDFECNGSRRDVSVNFTPGAIAVCAGRIVVPPNSAGKQIQIATYASASPPAWKQVFVSKIRGDLSGALAQGLTATGRIFAVNNVQPGDVWYFMVRFQLPFGGSSINGPHTFACDANIG